MGYVLTSAPLTPRPLPSDYNVQPEIRPPLSRAVAVGKERRIWCFVGGISEQDINGKTPTKLALVGFLSFHVAFKVKYCWGMQRHWETSSVDLSRLSCRWHCRLKAASSLAHMGCTTAAGTRRPSSQGLHVSSQSAGVLATQRAAQFRERIFHTHMWMRLLLTWCFFFRGGFVLKLAGVGISLLIAVYVGVS